jgi:hypothetical protein
MTAHTATTNNRDGAVNDRVLSRSSYAVLDTRIQPTPTAQRAENRRLDLEDLQDFIVIVVDEHDDDHAGSWV